MPSADPRPRRKTGELHRGRESRPGAVYFLSLVAQHPRPWFSSTAAAAALQQTLRAWHDEDDSRMLASTVMPDHMHALIVLGEKLSIGQVVGRWKSAVRKATGYHEDWQRDYWEHQVKDEDPEEFALYIFLNPYRARLILSHEQWPWWWTPQPEIFRFSEKLTGDSCPPAEWIDWPEDRFAHLAVGE